jgi:DNA-binding response OmpR family regulator
MLTSARGKEDASASDFTAGLTGADLEAALRDRILELETALGAIWRAPRVLHLTPTEERLLGALAAHRKMLTSDAIYNVIYGTKRNPPEPKIIGVLMFRIRQKLAPAGVTIVTEWGHGYFLPADSLDRLNALYVEGERA